MPSPNIVPYDPHTEYRSRLGARRAAAADLARRDRQLSDLRLWMIGGALLMGWLSVVQHLFTPWLTILPLVAFAVVVVLHDRIYHRGLRMKRSVRFYERGLARLEGTWQGTGVTGESYRDPAHPYADDLDLFGRGSLFELLCTARTRAGEETLVHWLLRPAAPEVVRARQAAVEELRGRLDLREDLALLGETVRGSADVDAIAAWGAEPRRLQSRVVPIIAGVLSLPTLAAAGWWLSGNGVLPFALTLLVGQAFAFPFGDRVRQVVRDVDRPARDLALFAALLRRLEAEQFTSPLLQGLAAELVVGGLRPSEQLARLERLVAYLQAQRNGVFALTGLGLMLMWSLQLAHAIEGWRAVSGPHLARWIAAIGEFEALNALASHAYEHPHDPFPEVVEAGPVFEAEGVGHPLLPEQVAVRNDLRLGSDLQLLVISGSNMSGKSTLIRSVGVNTVLALAGAPVRAHRLRVSPLAIGASIRVQDSLQEGISRFYAEILRLRQVVELSHGDLPLLFLLDEILHGTNSHDRRIGAEAVVRALVRDGAIGLMTTHDLALARIGDDPELPAANGHFEDQIVDGKMHFDYHLRPGVVQKSNALELMRSVGLDV